MPADLRPLVPQSRWGTTSKTITVRGLDAFKVQQAAHRQPMQGESSAGVSGGASGSQQIDAGAQHGASGSAS